MMSTDEFIQYCKDRHDIFCNQKYDNLYPYSLHLNAVYSQFRNFKHLLQPGEHVFVQRACYGHDLIEDARVTFNDLSQIIGTTTAEIIYCCTEEKGKNRDERHSDKYYTELASNRLAVFVKLCDIMANTIYSVLTNSSMFDKHKKEYQRVLKFLYREEYKEMFEHLQFLYSLKN